MISFMLRMSPRWRRFDARYQPREVRRWLQRTAQESDKAYKRGMRGRKTGIKHAGLPRRSSAPGEYPAVQSGGLIASIKTRVTSRQAQIGTRQHYARYLLLRNRRMSHSALREGLAVTRGTLRHAQWKRRRG